MTPNELAAFKAAHGLTVERLSLLLRECGAEAATRTVAGWLAGRPPPPWYIDDALLAKARERLGKLQETARQGPLGPSDEA